MSKLREMLAPAERRIIVLGAKHSNDAGMLAWQTNAQKRRTLTWQTNADTADRCWRHTRFRETKRFPQLRLVFVHESLQLVIRRNNHNRASQQEMCQGANTRLAPNQLRGIELKRGNCHNKRNIHPPYTLRSNGHS